MTTGNDIKKIKDLESVLAEKEAFIQILQEENNALNQKIKELDTIIASLPGTVYWKNKEGYYQGCNQNVVGVAPIKCRQEFIGKTLEQVVPPHIYAPIKEIDDRVIHQNQKINIEEHGVDKQGNPAVYLTQKTPLHDEEGNVIGLLGISFDITERKKLEEELLQAKKSLEKAYQEQQRHKELLRILPGNVYWKDREGRYLGCNDNMAKIFKLRNAEDVIGKTIFDLVENDNARMIRDIDEEIMRSNKSVFLEEPGLSMDGSSAIYLSKKTPLHNESGNVIGLLGVSFDITERKELERELNQTKSALQHSNQEQLSYIKQMQYLQDLISILPGNVYWKDRQGYYLGCNENMAKIAGIKSVHDIVGKTIYDVSDKDIAKQIDEIDERIMQENKMFSIEEEGLDALGKPAHYLTKKTPIRDQQGKVVGLVGISIDITKRKQLEENLKIAKQHAEEANHMKIAFIKNMEHDIRTPFCGVYGLSKFLLDHETDAEKKDILNDIVQSVEELLEYCNGVLEFTKAEFDQAVSIRKFNLKELMRRLFAMQKPAANSKGLALLLDIPEELPNWIVGDEYKLHRILINLVSNAVKFTEKGYIKVKVLIERCTEQDILLKFQVKDTGIGIAPEKQDLIYGLFTRLMPANQNIYKGLGVGLTIVKRFLEEMSGEIEVISRPGEGTIFTFKIGFQLPH